MEEKVIKGQDLSVVREEHVNKWVALSPDYRKILAVGDSLSAVLTLAKTSEKIVMKVLPNLGYAPMYYSMVLK
ncbi:MAG: hypothetical protein AAB415_01880 [Patescibacteria group bacterium]